MGISSQTLPNNIEAEQALLGILLNDVEILASVSNYPIPQDFFLERNSIIAKTIFELSDNGNQVDIISVSETLRSNKLLEKVGGVAYLSELTDKGFSKHNIEFYIDVIIGKSQRRNIIQHTYALLSQAQDESVDIDTLIEQSEKNIFAITDRSQSALYHHANEFFSEFIKLVQKRSKEQNAGEFSGIETKYPQLDTMLAGLNDGDLIILAARPSIGKTAFALNLINNISIENQIPAAFFSLEMSGMDIVSRLICIRTGIDSNKIRKNMLNTNDISNIMQKLGSKFNTPLYISDTSSLNIFDLKIQARRLVLKEQVKIIIVDYLGLIGYQNNRDSNNGRFNFMARYEKFSEISCSLKALARELKIPVIVLSQLNRDSEGKEPTLANIRESGAIEQDADVVLMLHRDNRNQTDTKLIIAKQRNGPTGEVNFIFSPSSTSFIEKSG